MSEQLTETEIMNLVEEYFSSLNLFWEGEAGLQSHADLEYTPTGDIQIITGIPSIINDIRARLLTRKETIINGVVYPAETSDPSVGSSLFYILGKKKTITNIRTAMVYTAEAIDNIPYLELVSVNAELISSEDLNKELVSINIVAKLVLNLGEIQSQGLNLEMKVVY